jgi:hypothetical protein
MSEMCPYCGKEFANTKALGSHLHYRHKSSRVSFNSALAGRTASEKKRFHYLLERCLLDAGLKLPDNIERIELALVEIPRGISPLLDQYRDPFNRAFGKEKLLKEVEDLLRQKEKG